MSTLHSSLQRITQEKTGHSAGMQIGDDQALLMEMLVRAMGAKRAIEIGTFTGYSALAVARGLGPEGHLDATDNGESVAAIRSLNHAIARDPRVKVMLHPLGDGVSFVRKL